MIITIIGCGPRGLSVALYALHKGHEVTIVDPSPLHTWSAEHLIPYLEMRSPLSFDLVTYIEELQQFSLAEYLGIKVPLIRKQYEIEADPNRVTREQFCNYLNYIFGYIQNKVKVIPIKAINVIDNITYLEDNSTIKADAVVFCTGYQGKLNIPNWLQNTSYLNLQIPLSTVITNPSQYKAKKWLVVGSGQGAAEAVEYLAKLKGQVYWATSKYPKVNQYPAPNYKLWGSKSALGSYFRGLSSDKDKLSYIQKVKAWQPSITPYIADKLKQVEYSNIKISNYNELAQLDLDYVVLNAGITPHINTLPCNVPTHKYFPNFPDISNHFRINLPNCSWYLSGILATAFDGPRQHSLISAGLTAKEIVEDIEGGNI